MSMVSKIGISILIAVYICIAQAFAQPPHHHGGVHRPPMQHSYYRPNTPPIHHNYNRPPINHSYYRPVPPPRRYYDSYGRLLLRDLTDSIIWSTTYNNYYRTSYPSTEYTKQYWINGVRYTCRSCSTATTLDCNLESNMKCCECVEQMLGK